MTKTIVRLLVSVVVGCGVLGGAASVRAEGLSAAECSDEAASPACAAAFALAEARAEAFGLAEERCDYAAQGWLESGIVESDVGGMYEACMRLSVPVWVTGLPAGRHYDTTDGAFWAVAP